MELKFNRMLIYTINEEKTRELDLFRFLFLFLKRFINIYYLNRSIYYKDKHTHKILDIEKESEEIRKARSFL
jgi:hypothetical protein